MNLVIIFAVGIVISTVIPLLCSLFPEITDRNRGIVISLLVWFIGIGLVVFSSVMLYNNFTDTIMSLSK